MCCTGLASYYSDGGNGEEQRGTAEGSTRVGRCYFNETQLCMGSLRLSRPGQDLTGVVCWGWCWGTGAGQTRRDKSTWHATVLCPPSHNVEAVPAVVAVRTVAWCGYGGGWSHFRLTVRNKTPKTVPSEERQEEDRRLALDAAPVDVHTAAATYSQQIV